MRVLLVDNDTLYKNKMSNLLQELEVTRVTHQEITSELLRDGAFDLVVLSGTQSKHSVKLEAESYWGNELELIRSAKIPVIGICLGAQLIAYGFGARLSNVIGGQRIKGIKRIYNLKKTPFTFFRYNGGRVFVSQRWRITELPDELEAWCSSAEGVDVFKHRTRPLYGLQFHPERRADDNDGARIFFTVVKEATGFESEILKTIV